MLIKLSNTEIWNKDRIECICVDKRDKTVYAVIWEGVYYDDGTKMTRRIDISTSFLEATEYFPGKTAEEFLDLLWHEILDNKDGGVDADKVFNDYLYGVI